ncbi:YdgH/BhsA/McbA-like domain containing protein [Pantoea ananatis]|uniref:YdgH/BhsA/McbA-like domain containing protein n=1 Tax=Pantoea ananas TaxID=553 RepID=UPI0011A0085A|nr:YdgH/BhsA/McbA-like domain containing protein [Pantoea ananatis]
MKSIRTFVAVSALTLVSFGSFAQSVTTTALTLDCAEAEIATQAQQQGFHYKITEASGNNVVHMTAGLYK